MFYASDFSLFKANKHPLFKLLQVSVFPQQNTMLTETIVNNTVESRSRVNRILSCKGNVRLSLGRACV